MLNASFAMQKKLQTEKKKVKSSSRPMSQKLQKRTLPLPLLNTCGTVAQPPGLMFVLNGLISTTSSRSLSDLESFISAAVAGLSQRVQEGDYGGLVEVMGHLLAVKERQQMTDSMFEPLQQTIALLKVYEQELPDVVYKQLEVRGRPSVTSPSLYCHVFFLFPHSAVAGTLLFLCVVQLPISSLFSGAW